MVQALSLFLAFLGFTLLRLALVVQVKPRTHAEQVAQIVFLQLLLLWGVVLEVEVQAFRQLWAVLVVVV